MNAVKTLFSWVLATILGVSLFILFMLGNISSFFTTGNMQKAAANIDVSHEIQKIKNSTATTSHKAEIADIINSAYTEAENHGIPSNLVDEIFNSQEVKEFLGKSLGGTTDYLINGNKETKVTSEEFNKLIDDNMDDWIKQSGTTISDSKKEVLVVRLKNASAGVIDNLPNSTNISNTVNNNTLKDVQFLFSSQVKVALVITSVISLLIIFFLKRKHNKWLLYSGIPTIIAGLITLGVSFIIVDLFTTALSKYNLTFMVSAFSDTLGNHILITGIVAIVISVIMLIIYKLTQKKTAN